MTYYLYIPGFNDRLDFLRRLALLRWKSRTSKATLVAMRWSDKSETCEQKYARIAEVIERATGDEIVLVGESAGGAMALLAFARNLERVSRVVTVCGYNHGSADIHAIHRQQKPAFYEASREAEKTIETFSPSARRRITTIYSTADKLVTPDHTRIDGAHEKVLHKNGHLLNIIWILMRGL